MSQGTPNPYQSPKEQSLGMGGAQPSARTAQMLMQTRPWVKFIGVLMFILIVLMSVIAVGMLFFGATQGEGQLIAMGIMYLIMPVLYFFPARFLLRYASRIEAFTRNGTTENLDDALEAQKSFWKFAGIVAAIFTVIYGVMIAIGLVVGGISVLGS